MADTSTDPLYRAMVADDIIRPGVDTSKAAIAAVVERLQDHLTLKWMSPPSKITGEECQMITVEALEQTLVLISALEAERDALKQINANLMGDDENVPRYTTRRLKQEIARHMEAAEALNASLISALEAERDGLLDGNGWVYLNPDSGMEHRPDHPIESGECPDAELIRRSTSQEDALGQHAQHWFTRAEAAEALNATLQAKLEKAAEALEPFAKCSEVYPGADPEAEAAFGSMYDPRCPLKLGDFHWARSTLSTLREAGNDQT